MELINLRNRAKTLIASVKKS